MATINHALAESERTGQRWYDAELHRTRGEILLKQNVADFAPAEQAYLTAIAIAQHQKARSFELRLPEDAPPQGWPGRAPAQ